MTTILAIDPGNIESGWVLMDADTYEILAFNKTANNLLLAQMWAGGLDADHVYIEMIASYGMAVGESVFETCVWIGRFMEAANLDAEEGEYPIRVKRQPIKLHHCHSSRAKDSNVKQALVDRFAPNTTNGGKGTRADPGYFYGFKADVWQAFALAVYAADQLNGTEAA